MSSIDLSTFGLDTKEEKCYLALLELGEANLGELARKAGIKRTTAYDVVESLHGKGLVGLSKKKKRTVYFAEDPRVLGQQIDEQRQKLDAMLPELLSFANNLTKKPKISYYEGTEGIKQVYKDTLRFPDQELLAWVAEEALKYFDAEFLSGYYLPKRLEKKIWVRAIAPDEPEMREYAGLDEKSLRRTRLVPKDTFPFDVEINLYGKRFIAIMSFEEGFGMIIESEKLFRTMKSMFEMGWIFAGKGESQITDNN